MADSLPRIVNDDGSLISDEFVLRALGEDPAQWTLLSPAQLAAHVRGLAA